MSRLNETEATVEQRARAVRYWEQEIRPRIAPKEQAEPKEDPFAALVRLKSQRRYQGDLTEHEQGWGRMKSNER
jgi:hypothetical protein